MRRVVIVTISILMLTIVSALVLSPRRVYGVVSDNLNGQVIAGATVVAGDHKFSSHQVGNFNLEWIHGTVTLAVKVDGYVESETRVPNGRFPGQRIPMHISLSPNALAGVVRDSETGDPLSGTVVSAGGLHTATDERGKYVLRRVLTGTQLSASMPGYRTSTTIFGGQRVEGFALEPTETRILVTDLYSRQPVPNATILCGSQRLNADATGVVIIERLVQGTELSIQAVGYAPVGFAYNGDETVSVDLRPNTLEGVIGDSSGGEPVAGAAVSVVSAAGVITSLPTQSGGHYAFVDLPSPPITLEVCAEGYDEFKTEVGPVTQVDVYLKRFQAKGIYMPLGILVSEERVQGLIDLVQRTELNAIVLDVKNDRGWIGYPSKLAVAQQSGAYKSEVMDIGEFLSRCHERDIYAIARLVIFKDPTLVSAYPEWAVGTESGEPYVDLEGSSWGDPFREKVRDYNIAIAKEVAALGFDELQFDYLRFPSGGAVHEALYQRESTAESRCKLMDDFCKRLRTELKPYSVVLSADLFGLTAWVPPGEDMGIGQRVIDIAPHMDLMSPMVYPATFVEGNLGYDEPMSYPYEVVYRSCIELANRTETRIRPWLQHYWYGADEMRLQKDAAEKAGTEGWMFWNAAGKYNEQVFDRAEDP